jgi:hypothetical protein
MSAAAGGQLSMLQLYRHILKAAQQFPSIKRPSIIQQVKTEFRQNKVGILLRESVLDV